MNIMDYLREAPVGTRARIANALRIPKPLLSQWLTTRGVPPHRVLDLAAATYWVVTPHDLRPDLYPHPDDGLPNELRGQRKPKEAS